MTLLLLLSPLVLALAPQQASRSARNDIAAPRTLCSRCVRPPSVCICEALPAKPLHTQTRLLILQHPAEARKRVATVPIIPLCVANCTIVRGNCFDAELPAFVEAMAEGFLPLLLYPSPEAPTLESWAATRAAAAGAAAEDAAQAGPPVLLVVIHSVHPAAAEINERQPLGLTK